MSQPADDDKRTNGGTPTADLDQQIIDTEILINKLRAQSPQDAKAIRSALNRLEKLQQKRAAKPPISEAPTPSTPTPTRAPTGSPIADQLSQLRVIETLLQKTAPGSSQLGSVQREIQELLKRPEETGDDPPIDRKQEEDIPAPTPAPTGQGDTEQKAAEEAKSSTRNENQEDVLNDPVINTWKTKSPEFVDENIRKAEEVSSNIRVDNIPGRRKKTEDWYLKNTVNPTKENIEAMKRRTEQYEDIIRKIDDKLARTVVEQLLDGEFNNELFAVLVLFMGSPAFPQFAMSYGWWNQIGMDAAQHSAALLGMGADQFTQFVNSNTVGYLVTTIRGGMSALITAIKNDPLKAGAVIKGFTDLFGEFDRTQGIFSRMFGREEEEKKTIEEPRREEEEEKTKATPINGGREEELRLKGGAGGGGLPGVAIQPTGKNQLEGPQGVPGISIPARMGVSGSNPEQTGAEVSTETHPISFTASDLITQKELLGHIRITMSEVVSFFNGDEWSDFSETLSEMSSLKHRRPEEEEKMHVDFTEKDAIEDPQSMVDGIGPFVNVNANIVKRSIEALDSLIQTSITSSETDLMRNHHLRKKQRIDVERVKRANRKKLRELFSGSTNFSRGRKKALTTGEFTTIEHVPAALVGRMLNFVLMKQNIHSGDNAETNFSRASDLNTFAERSAADQLKEQDLFTMNEIRFQWDVMHNVLDEMASNIKMAVHAASASGAGQLLTTKLVILLIESMARAKSSLNYSTNKPEDPRRDGGNNEFQTSGNSAFSGGGTGREGDAPFQDFQSVDDAMMNNLAQAMMPDMKTDDDEKDNETDRNSVNPLSTQEHLQIRPSFLEIGGKAVQKAREDEILNDLLWNSFDYVSPNGYLGEKNKIHRDNLRNQQIRAMRPLYFGQTWEPNHGLHPLTAQLQTVKRPRDVQNWAAKIRRRNSVKRRHVKTTEILHGDLNEMKSTKGLPFRKPSPFRFTTDNQFQLQPAFLPDGHTLNKQRLRDATSETWNFPHQAPKVISISQTTKPLQEKMAQYFTHYSNVATY